LPACTVPPSVHKQRTGRNNCAACMTGYCPAFNPACQMKFFVLAENQPLACPWCGTIWDTLSFPCGGSICSGRHLAARVSTHPTITWSSPILAAHCMNGTPSPADHPDLERTLNPWQHSSSIVARDGGFCRIPAPSLSLPYLPANRGDKCGQVRQRRCPINVA